MLDFCRLLLLHEWRCLLERELPSRLDNISTRIVSSLQKEVSFALLIKSLQSALSVGVGRVNNSVPTLPMFANLRLLAGPDGMERFCRDLRVDPENIVMLVIAWKMDAKNMGYFTAQEWVRGLSQLQ